MPCPLLKADKTGLKAYALEKATAPVKERQVSLTDAQVQALHRIEPSVSMATAVGIRYDIPYCDLPCCYYRHGPALGHIYLYRSAPMKNKKDWRKL